MRPANKLLQDALRVVQRDVAAQQKKLDQLKAYEQTLLDMIAFYAPNDDGTGTPRTPDGAGRTARQPTKEVRNAIYDVLKAAGVPLHSKDILQALEARGITVTGKDPANNVRSHLSHDGRFRSVGNGRWDLRSRANGSGPPAQPPRTNLAERLRGTRAVPDPPESGGSGGQDEADPFRNLWGDEPDNDPPDDEPPVEYDPDADWKDVPF